MALSHARNLLRRNNLSGDLTDECVDNFMSFFARHRLSPLAAFTSGAYFLFTMEGGDSEFANFTLPTLKAFLEARSQNVSGYKQ